jgi:hypothetical protein
MVKATRRHDELDTIVTKLYETYALGKLPENHFERMIAEYDSEQKTLMQEIQDLQEQIDSHAADSIRTEKFMEVVRRYTEYEELTVPMLNEFIEKVVVHESNKSRENRIQKLEVHLNFIGNFHIPYPEKTTEEIEAERKRAERRRKVRERQREYRARKKEEVAKESNIIATPNQSPDAKSTKRPA